MNDERRFLWRATRDGRLDDVQLLSTPDQEPFGNQEGDGAVYGAGDHLPAARQFQRGRDRGAAALLGGMNEIPQLGAQIDRVSGGHEGE